MSKIIIGLVLFFGIITIWVVAEYQWNKQVESYWELSDRSSTLQAKEQYIAQFVEKLGELPESSALIFVQPKNNCRQNVEAVKTLEKRLHDIQGMDETSFQYQTAIQQITEQEQGQAENLMGTLSGCWKREHYYLAWNPIIGSLAFIGGLVLPFVGFLL